MNMTGMANRLDGGHAGESAGPDLSALKGRRIVFILWSLHLGGAERQAFLVARALKEQGACPHVMGFMGPPGPVADMCDEAGIPWSLLPYRLDPNRRDALANRLALLRALRRLKADGVITYCRDPHVDAALVWRFSGTRFCFWNQRDAGLLLRGGVMENLAARLVSRMLTNAEHTAKFLADTYHLSGERICVIRNGLVVREAVQGRAAWRRALGIPESEPVACMVANYHAFKYHDRAVRIWASVLRVLREQGFPGQPCLVFAGKDHGGVAGLKELARSLGIPDQSIRFHDFVEDVPGLYGAADVCLFYSRSEGCPNAVLEAMAAGLPVAGSDIPGLREAVGEEGYSCLAPEDDLKACAGKLAALLVDPEKRRTLGEKMKTRASQVFDLEACVQAHVELMRPFFACGD